MNTSYNFTDHIKMPLSILFRNLSLPHLYGECLLFLLLNLGHLHTYVIAIVNLFLISNVLWRKNLNVLCVFIYRLNGLVRGVWMVLDCNWSCRWPTWCSWFSQKSFMISKYYFIEFSVTSFYNFWRFLQYNCSLRKSNTPF